MSTIIPRIYDSYGDALDAKAALRKRGFREEEITLISNAPNREEGAAESTVAAVEGSGIPAADASAFAAAVDRGQSLLVVRAVFGAALKAMRAVDSHNPLDAGIGRAEYSSVTTRPTAAVAVAVAGAPSSVFSSIFGWPMLLTEAAPFSNLWKWPLLLDNAAPLSSWLGWPTLSSGFTFGVPKLSDGFTFGVPKLSNGFTFGIPKLSSDAAPLSNALGMPLLLNGAPAPKRS